MTKATGSNPASAGNAKKAKRAARKLEKKSVARSLADAAGIKKGGAGSGGNKNQGGKDKSKKFQKPSSNGNGKSFKKEGFKPRDGAGQGSAEGKRPEKKKWEGGNNKKPASGGGQDRDDKKRKYSGASEKQGGGKKFAKPAGKESGDAKWNYKRAKPNATLVQNLNQSWNKVRTKTIKPEERASIVNGMMQQLDKHLLEVTLRHDASRAVQSIIQFGTPAQRGRVLEAIQSKFSEIAKTPYGHFVGLKAITYCNTADEQRRIAAGLSGHFVAVGTNVIGARTAEALINVFPAKASRGLKAEFYGNKFVTLTSEPPKNLRSLIESLPAKKAPLMDHMRDLVQKFVDKGLLAFSFVHQLIAEYTDEVVAELIASPEIASQEKNRMTDLLELLVDNVTKLMVTKAGARVVCYLATYGTAKDRKRMLKPLKGNALESFCHESGHLAMMRLLDVTDDTVTAQKSILEEIRSVTAKEKYTASGELMGVPMPPLVTIATNKYGRKFLIRLLAPHLRHLEPNEEALFPDASLTSKKSPESKRREHLAYLRNAIISTFTNHADLLARSMFGSQALYAALWAFLPQQLLGSLVNVYSNLPIEQIVSDDAEMEEAGDDEEAEEGEEEGEEEDGADEEEEGAGEGDEEIPEDEEEEEEEEDRGSAAAVAAPEALPIEEDPAAHHLLKQVLQLQAAFEAQHAAAAETGSKKKTKKAEAPAAAAAPASSVQLDESLWEPSEGGARRFEFAQDFLSSLEQNDLLSTWVSKNRPCFALAEALKVRSAAAQGKSLLSGLGKAIKKTAAEAPGGKVLADVLKQ